MANKEFQVRHGLAVNNNVLVANTVTGNVSIGTSTANAKLDIGGDVTNKIRLSSSGDSTNFYSEFINYYNSGKAFEIMHGGVSFLRTSQQGYYNVEFGPAQYHWRTNYGDGYISANTNSAERMRITSTGNVGIGTTAPANKLDVRGTLGVGQSSNSALNIFTITSSIVGADNHSTTFAGPVHGTNDVVTFNLNRGGGAYGAFDVKFGGVSRFFIPGENLTGDASIDLPTNSNFIFKNNNVEGMRFNANGNLGIGTTTPSAKLHVAGDAIFTGNVTISGNTSYMNTQTLLIGDNLITLNADIPSNTPGTENAGIEVNRGSLGNASFIWDETSDRWDVRANNSNLISILSTGGVGIGTTSPGTAIDVNRTTNDVTIRAKTSGAGAWFYADSGSAGYSGLVLLGNGTEKWLIGNYGTNNLTFKEGRTGSEWMTIVPSSGNVGIGTSSPGTALDIFRNTGNDDTLTTLRISTYANPGDQYGVRLASAKNATGVPYAQLMGPKDGNGWLSFTAGVSDNVRMLISGTGNIGIGTTSPSYRLDVNAAVANGVRFDGARPITFNSNGTGDIRIKASAGGWSIGYLFSGSAGTDLGGFGAYGGSDSLTYHWIGTAYNTPTAVFTSGGNVGIGTINPGYILDVQANTGSNHYIQVKNYGSLGGRAGIVLDSSGGSDADVVFRNQGISTATIASFPYAQVAPLVFYTNNSTTMVEVARFNNSGFLGIGTPSPQYRLDIGGTIRANGYTIGVDSGPNIKYVFTNDGGASYINSGNFGIGTTSPQVKLDVRGVIQGSSYTIPDTSGSYQWVKLGTFTAAQQGYTAHIRAYIHAGYNALNSQDFYVDIFFKTSNGSSVDSNGFAGNSWYYGTGFQLHPIGPKWVGNAAGVSATSYDLYLYLPSFTLRSHYKVEIPDGATWVHTGTIGQTDPGSSSNTVCVSSAGYNILYGNVGIGTTTPAANVHVKSNANATMRLEYAAGGIYSAGYEFAVTGYANPAGLTYYDNGTELRVWTQHPTSSKVTLFTANTERMRINTNGNVGIGNTAPDALLHVAGTTILGGDTVGVMDVKFSRSLGGTRAINHWFTHSSNSPWYLFGQNMTWNGERTGTVDPTHAYRPYYEAYAPVVGYKEFGFANVSSGSIASSNLIANMVLTNTGNVGIGTTSPSAKLHVAGGYTILADHNTQSAPTTTLGATALSWNYSGGNAEVNFWNLWNSAVGGGFRFSQKTGTSTFNDVYWAANTYHVWYTTGVERMRIDASGNIGIGTSNPSQRLEVAGIVLVNGLRLNGTDGNVNQIWQSNSNTPLGLTAAGGPIIFGQTSSEKMRIDSAGNVGIGTTSPAQKLDVVGAGTQAIRVYNSTTNADAYLIAKNSLGEGLFGINATGPYLYTSAAIPMLFYTSALERMRIDSSGNVGIGSVPVDKLSVYVTPPTAGGSGLKITDGTRSTQINITGATYSYNGVGANEVLLYAGGGALSLLADGQPIKFCSGGERMRITSTGNVAIGITTASYLFDVYNSSTASNYYISRLISEAAATGTSVTHLRLEKGNGYGGTVGGYISQGVGSGLVLSTLNAGTLSNAMWINNSGNVGIGTASPGHALHVSGASTSVNVQDTSGTGAYITLTRGTGAFPASGAAAFSQFNGSLFIKNLDTGPTVFSTTASDTERMRITNAGNVGIGTSSPISRLHIQRTSGAASDGEFWSSEGTYWTMLNSRQSGSAYSSLVQGNDHAIIYSDGSADTGAFVIAQWSNSARGMRIDSSGNVAIGQASTTYKLQVNGSFAANTKSFVIDHPTKPGMKLRHGSLEGPENGVYVRGQTKEKVIELPEYWRGLVDSSTITVQLTSIGRPQNVYVVDVSDNRVYIDTENHTDVNCYYFIQAERKDVEKLVVEY